jgi:hypothetical protein
MVRATPVGQVRTVLLVPNTVLSSPAWFFSLVPLYLSTLEYATLFSPHPPTDDLETERLCLPKIIRALGYTATMAQLLTVPLNRSAFLVVLVSAAHSDKFRARGCLMLGGCLLAITGYAMLVAAKLRFVNYSGTFFVRVGVLPGKPNSARR